MERKGKLESKIGASLTIREVLGVPFDVAVELPP
jgi:hypothetical protein